MSLTEPQFPRKYNQEIRKISRRPISHCLISIGSMRPLLVVDDDEQTCDAVQRLLGRMGYLVACAGSGRDALDVLHDLGFDLVILDWMMPELDGLEVLRRLRADPHTRDTKVLMYSAADDPATAEEAVRLGASDCVLKSGGFFALYDRIEALLSPDGEDIAGGAQAAGADVSRASGGKLDARRTSRGVR